MCMTRRRGAEAGKERSKKERRLSVNWSGDARVREADNENRITIYEPPCVGHFETGMWSTHRASLLLLSSLPFLSAFPHYIK